MWRRLMGQGRKWPRPFLLTFHWRKLSHMAIADCQGGWEISLSFVPRKRGTNIAEQLVMTFPGGQSQVMEPCHKMTENCWTQKKNL